MRSRPICPSTRTRTRETVERVEDEVDVVDDLDDTEGTYTLYEDGLIKLRLTLRHEETQYEMQS